MDGGRQHVIHAYRVQSKSSCTDRISFCSRNTLYKVLHCFQVANALMYFMRVIILKRRTSSDKLWNISIHSQVTRLHTHKRYLKSFKLQLFC